MSQKIAGTFAGSAGTNTAGQTSDVLMLPTGMTDLRLTVTGDVDANNQVRLQRSTSNGAAWSTAHTASSAVSNASLVGLGLTVDVFQQWRVLSLTSQAGKTIHYSLSAEN
jgi:hypothetical protein